MKLNITKEEDNRMEFTLGDASLALANVIRRYVSNHVPIFAINNVTFYENTTSMFDEYIAHRIGMVPLTTPPTTTEKEEVVFHIDEEGPKVVYAKDLKTKDKDVKPAKDNIVIITLGEGQKLKLEGKARVGIGREHAKFQAGIVSYEIDEKKENKEEKEIIKFYVESFYQMSPKEMLTLGCKTLERDLKELQKAIEKTAKSK